MSLTLYGSLPSPYVRRIRMFMESMDYDFKPINVYDDATRANFAAITPIRKLPVLVDGESTILDSHVIQDYLRRKRGLPEPGVEEHNLVTVIDAATDSMIILFMGQRSELEVSADRLLFKLQLERIPDSLGWLEQQAEQDAFNEWDFATMCLVAMVDWVEFRELYEFSAYPALLAARDLHKDRDIVIATRPE